MLKLVLFLAVFAASAVADEEHPDGIVAGTTSADGGRVRTSNDRTTDGQVPAKDFRRGVKNADKGNGIAIVIVLLVGAGLIANRKSR